MLYRLDITRRLQDRLLEIVKTALPLMTRSMADADITGLAHLRREMVVAMEAYRDHVRTLRDGAGSGDDLRYFNMLDAGCASLEASYDAFRKRWVHRDGGENWYEYRLSAIVMMKQIRDRVQMAEQARTTHLAA